MLRFKFTAAKTTQNYLGWKDSRIAEGSPYGPLVEAFGLAHDCMDHFALTSLSDEIEANGAMYYGRYEENFEKLGYSSYSVMNLRGLGYQWHNIARALDEHNLPPAPVIHNVRIDIIDAAIREGYRALKGSYHANWEQKAKKIAEVYRGWFTIGFLKAKARWEAWGYTKAERIKFFARLQNIFEVMRPTCKDDSMDVMIYKNGEILTLRHAGKLDQEWQTHK